MSKDQRYDSLFLTNYAQINLVNQLGSLAGVGESRLASQQVYSMRVWVNPDKMTTLGLNATDISTAIQAQNRQNPAGAIGQAPSPQGTDFQYAVSAPGRLTDAFAVRRHRNPGAARRIAAARARYRASGTWRAELWRLQPLERQASGNVIIYLVAGRERRGDRQCGPGVHEASQANVSRRASTTSFLTTRRCSCATAIKDVVETLMEAVLLVILVVFVFLQNWRATLIPLLTVPVAVIGTFALFPLLGFSINITSMFGLVLAIGIVVDDAIVVVEAVQRHIDDGMSARDATIQAMNEVSAPVVAIAFILAAVFIPVAFIGGISGQIYKQFALTIAVSVLLSAFSALSLSPALAALLLRPHKTIARLARARFRLVQSRLRLDTTASTCRRSAS